MTQRIADRAPIVDSPLMPPRARGMFVIVMFPLDTRPMPYVGKDTCPSG